MLMMHAAAIGELKKTAVEVEWNIPKFLACSSDIGEKVESPHFKFLDYDWYLQIYPNGDTRCKTPGNISLFVNKVGVASTPFVEYSLALKSTEGEKLFEFEEIRTYVTGWGKTHFTTESQLLDKKTSLLPGGTLTVLCSLKLRDPYTVSRPDKLLQDFQSLLSNEIEADVTVKVDEEEFRLHKNVLSARNPYFAGMFKHEMSEKLTGIVTIGDCKADTFRLFVHYMYTGRAELSDENVFPLFKLADMYQVKELKVKCLECIRNTLSVNTFFDAMDLLLIHENENLLEEAKLLLSKKMVRIMGSGKWEGFVVKNPVWANKLLFEVIKLKVVDENDDE